LISNGWSAAAPGSLAPTSAHGAFIPATTLGAPQTIASGCPLPTSTRHTVNLSAFGCFSTLSTRPTTTPVKGGATLTHCSTSRPDMVNRCASASVVNGGSTSVRNHFSENCICVF
jgi:hypothetical protein